VEGKEFGINQDQPVGNCVAGWGGVKDFELCLVFEDSCAEVSGGVIADDQNVELGVGLGHDVGGIITGRAVCAKGWARAAYTLRTQARWFDPVLLQLAERS